MSKKRHSDAYHAMSRLRYNKIQAARDIFYMAELLKAEEAVEYGHNKVLELITVPRNRRALIGSEIVMFMQQFCGVNVIGTSFCIDRLTGGKFLTPNSVLQLVYLRRQRFQ